MANTVASLLHPKLLVLLLFVETLLVIYHGKMSSWHYVWIPIYIHDLLLLVAFIYWLRRAYTRPLKVRILYGVLLLSKLSADALLPVKLDGHSGITYLSAVIPLLLFFALLLFTLWRDMRDSLRSR
eukprot:m.13521 g.13521  ORF g.13521 m.13521 type:complete len:126 (+) comp10174_c0_seq1:80-457(+)